MGVDCHSLPSLFLLVGEQRNLYLLPWRRTKPFICRPRGGNNRLSLSPGGGRTIGGICPWGVVFPDFCPPGEERPFVVPPKEGEKSLKLQSPRGKNDRCPSGSLRRPVFGERLEVSVFPGGKEGEYSPVSPRGEGREILPLSLPREGGGNLPSFCPGGGQRKRHIFPPGRRTKPFSCPPGEEITVSLCPPGGRN